MDINEIILYKFGWDKCRFWNKPFLITDFKKNDIKYDFLDKFFIIQNPDTLAHFFVVLKDEDIVKSITSKPSLEIKKCEMFLIKTNQELFKLIIKYEAFSENYQRHFRINKILKQ